MTLEEMVKLLNADLVNEYTHMMFYTANSSSLIGLQREVFSSVFRKHAKSEMEHCLEFQDLIVSLGGSPTVIVHPVPTFCEIKPALDHAVALESEVVSNYFDRVAQAEKLGGFNGLRIKLFVEKQFEDSVTDMEEFKKLTKEI